VDLPANQLGPGLEEARVRSPRRPAPSLSLKQRRFVSEYLKDLNVTQAAVRAGYNAATARVQGPRLLLNVACRSIVEPVIYSGIFSESVH
jgi:hypothetical protein